MEVEQDVFHHARNGRGYLGQLCERVTVRPRNKRSLGTVELREWGNGGGGD